MKTASNRLIIGIALAALAGAASAVQGLDAHGTSKVDKALAKKWATADTSKDGYQAQQSKSVVNIGNKKVGNCVVNVGTTQKEKGMKGQRMPKDVVVTTKEVINVCK